MARVLLQRFSKHNEYFLWQSNLSVYVKYLSAFFFQVEPIFDRMIFFWSDRRNPHEVLPANRDRCIVIVLFMERKKVIFSSIFDNRDRCTIIVLFMERKEVIFSSIFANRDRCIIIVQNLQMKKVYIFNLCKQGQVVIQNLQILRGIF